MEILQNPYLDAGGNSFDDKAICVLQAIKPHCISFHFFSLQFTCTCSQLWENYGFLPTKISLSLCFRGNTELIFVLYPDLLPYSLDPHLTSTTRTPGDSQAIRVPSKIKGLSPMVEVHLPWPGRLSMSPGFAGPSEEYLIYPKVWDQLVPNIVALIPSCCLLCKAGSLILKKYVCCKTIFRYCVPSMKWICSLTLWPGFWKNFTTVLSGWMLCSVSRFVQNCCDHCCNPIYHQGVKHLAGHSRQTFYSLL